MDSSCQFQCLLEWPQKCIKFNYLAFTLTICLNTNNACRRLEEGDRCFTFFFVLLTSNIQTKRGCPICRYPLKIKLFFVLFCWKKYFHKISYSVISFFVHHFYTEVTFIKYVQVSTSFTQEHLDLPVVQYASFLLLFNQNISVYWARLWIFHKLVTPLTQR